MTEIYLVRHGETAWSRSGRHTSVTDLDLTEIGVRQAESLKGRLDPAAFDLVLSSPRLRARRTAELAGFSADRVELCEDLVEWDYGDYEGVTSADIRAERPGWTIWTGDVPGGETAEQVRARLTRVIDRAAGSGLDRVLCFGHGHGLRAMTLCWLGLDFGLGDSFPLATGTVSVLAPYKGGRALSRWNSQL
ncbi:histidine phosphatase family protein [Pseudactinotalea sp. HY160]|uniref:histidine phosphatase family protein n=1 Tax=Pseudactinotalea sp. HY160 TaxID=2654490 RepID=UPI00128C5B65|nr:histidine phosphatase family protein [Pseudactinotalea sp. HY160]MPV51202.1 histidine phosphatase family protein [Pseudactinotalea sp. HY160]